MSKAHGLSETNRILFSVSIANGGISFKWSYLCHLVEYIQTNIQNY